MGTDPQHSLEKIISLTILETTTCIIIGVLPGMSSTFTRKYVQAGSNSSKRMPASGVGTRISGRAGRLNTDSSKFLKLGETTRSRQMDEDGLQSPNLQQVKVFAEEHPASSSGSIAELQLIRKTTDIEIQMHHQE
jgi:hypothetical protein